MDFEYIQSSLELKYQLPLSYKKLLNNFPQELINRYPVQDDEEDTGNESLSAAEELLSDSQNLIQLNHDFRDWVENADTNIDINQWFAIGSQSGYPNYYLINLKEDSEQVYFFDHDEGEIRKRYSTFHTFLVEVYDSFDSLNDPDY